MGTRSKGRQGVYASMLSTRRERLCDNGAFGQSEHQRIRNHNIRVTTARAEQDKSTTTKPKG